MPQIIESIGAWGVVTTPKSLINVRCQQPHSGDPVLIPPSALPGYNYTRPRTGRLEYFGSWKSGHWLLCLELGSAFLREDGTVSISGGPFACVKPSDLIPTYQIIQVKAWNWADRSPGAHQGITYAIDRPLFELRPQNHSQTDEN